jgi:16S rRNA A1518/A1519 N6-dimethyltransferase RsmA/KsgA/DIM1 with predicted DNA glycosylase/AP lyase activity
MYCRHCRHCAARARASSSQHGAGAGEASYQTANNTGACDSLRLCLCSVALVAGGVDSARASAVYGDSLTPSRRGRWDNTSWCVDCAHRLRISIGKSCSHSPTLVSQQDMTVVDDAVSAAHVSVGDRVLEVGPGTGVLTRALVAAGASVTALEKDAALAASLGTNNAALVQAGGLCVVHDDVLRWLRSPGSHTAFPPVDCDGCSRRGLVVANIPFGISTDLLSLLLPRGDAFSSITLLVQEEWAQRLVVAQRTGESSDAREMSIRVAFYSPKTRYIRNVPRACFAPPPNVDCAVVRFDLAHPSAWPLPPSHTASFFTMVRAAFNARRKMLRNTLPGCEEHLIALGLALDVRPQQVDMRTYVAIYKAMRMQNAGTEA